jgi:hypothetical protein
VAGHHSARLSFDAVEDIVAKAVMTHLHLHVQEGAVAFVATQEPTFNKWLSGDEPAEAP